MGIRHLTLYLVVTGLSIYAWKDWFKSLCGLILLMAIIQHEDMPKTMFGIQGLNVWNVLFTMVLLAYITARHREGLTWDMPRHVSVLLLLYVGVILIGVLRAVFDRSHLQGYPLGNLISEELINTIKWMLPGLLLFDGCRTRRRVITALICVLTMYLLIAAQVVLRLPPSSVFSAGGEISSTRRACSDIGYGACDMSTFLAGASWATLATLTLVTRKKHRLAVLAAAGMLVYGQALTGGRAGYLAWGATGLVLCLLKWRKYLILAPVLLLLLPMVFPGPTERMLQGFGQTDASGQKVIDDNSVTSGRTLVWPHVIDKIAESPLVGHGRLAVRRTGLQLFLLQLYGEGEAVGQAHNMYLETLLDNGILGSTPIFLFWGMMVLYSAGLFRRDSRLYSAVGGIALSLMLAQLVAGIGSQHFYPRESTLGMWVAIFLALRVHVEEMRARRGTIEIEDSSIMRLQQHAVAASV